MGPDLQKMAIGANTIRGYFQAVRTYANINTTKQQGQIFISAYFRIFGNSSHCGSHKVKFTAKKGKLPFDFCRI